MNRRQAGRIALGLAVLLAAAVPAMPVAAAHTSGGRHSSTLLKTKKTEFTNENYAVLASNPKKYKGSSVDVVGKVFAGVERDLKGTYFQMWADPKNSEGNTIVAIADPNLQIADGDYVHVVGKVLGRFKGKNSLGGTITAVRVLARTVEKTDALAAASPPIREVPLGIEQDQYGVTLRLEKIQFAADETRLFVTLRNGADSNASFYSFDAKAVQGTNQFDEESNFEYPEVSSDVLPGVSSSGVIAFPAMDPRAETTVVLEARNDNFRLDFTPYTFAIPAG